MTVLISVAPLLIWWVDDKVLQKLHHAVTFDLLLSLMAVELIFSPKILPDLIFQMCAADGDFVMASDQKLAHIGNHTEGNIKQYAATYHI